MDSFRKRLRVPPLAGPSISPETEQGVLLDDWAEVEEVLRYFSKKRNRYGLSGREKRVIVRSIISPDERERLVAFEIVAEMVENLEIDNRVLLDILMDFLLEKIGHYGIDLVINIIAGNEYFSNCSVSEICIPLLTKSLNYNIRLEIYYAVIGSSIRFHKEVVNLVTECTLRLCRSFASSEAILSLAILEEILQQQDSIELSCAMSICKILNIFLVQENQMCIRRVFGFLDNEQVYLLLGKHGHYVVMELFEVVYSLSQRYWKKTEQVVICEILQKLFLLDKDSFDLSLREYNMQRYTCNKNSIDK